MKDHWGYVRSFCPSCGAQYIAGQKFCQECGKRLEDERVINMESGIFTDNPDDTMRYIASCDRVESVDVVRCNDCSHTNARSKDGEYWHCGMFNLWMNKDFYCADGKRRRANEVD